MEDSRKRAFFVFISSLKGAHTNVFNLAILIDLREELFLTKNLARLAAPPFPSPYEISSIRAFLFVAKAEFFVFVAYCLLTKALI